MAKKIAPITNCRDCIHATDFHEKDSKGEFFLCRCKFSKRSHFLDRDTCENYQPNETYRKQNTGGLRKMV